MPSKKLSSINAFEELINLNPRVDILPFLPASISLKESLRKNHIKRVAIWLLGNQPDSIRAQLSGSPWESAKSVIVLRNIRQIFLENIDEDPEYKIIATRIEQVSCQILVPWLLDLCDEKTSPDKTLNLFSWDDHTWDTSVIIRSLLRCLTDYETSTFLTQENKKKIKLTAIGGLLWAQLRFNKFLVDKVKYPFGPADVAQILICSVYASNFHPNIYDEIKSKYENFHQEDAMLQMANYFNRIKTKKEFSYIHDKIIQEQEITYWWDDYFNTAETIEALGYYYNYCHSLGLNKKPTHINELAAIEESIVQTCRFYEQTQSDGMWGGHVETSRSIKAYVYLTASIPFLDSEIHTTFKAIRWLCDPQQVFNDGSFLHTMFLTTFYSHALIEIYNSWKPALENIIDIYDDVVWRTPVATTSERSVRLLTSLKNSRLEEEISNLGVEHNQLKEKLMETADDSKKVFLSIIILVIAIILANYLGNTPSQKVFSIAIKITTGEGIWDFAALFLAGTSFVLGLIWNKELFKKYREITKRK